MGKATTLPNGVKAERLTVRQQLDAREMSMRFAMKLMSQLACFALGLEEDPETGIKIKPMTAPQIRAAETVLRKILPDQSAIAVQPTDDFDNMSRDELIEMLAAVVADRPELAENQVIREAVNKAQTVVEFPKNDSA